MRAFGQSVCFEISSGERLTPQSQHKAAAFLQCFTCFSALQLRNTLLHFEHFRNIFKNGIPTNSPFLLLLLLILRMLLLFVLLLLLLMFLLAMFLLLLLLFVFLFFLLSSIHYPLNSSLAWLLRARIPNRLPLHAANNSASISNFLTK